MKKQPTPVQARYLEVTPRPGEPAERMIKRFTRKVRNEGVMDEIYTRCAYMKPSEKRRKKALAAQFRRESGSR